MVDLNISKSLMEEKEEKQNPYWHSLMPINEPQNEFSERHQILIFFECEFKKKQEKKKQS